jgi:hypothetical protein
MVYVPHPFVHNEVEPVVGLDSLLDKLQGTCPIQVMGVFTEIQILEEKVLLQSDTYRHPKKAGYKLS